MNLRDVQAVIDSAKVRDDGKLEEFVRQMAPTATEQEVADAASVAVEVVETVPLLLARAAQAAEQRGLKVVVMPLLEHAARYFVNPIDLIPEVTQGLAGLLDDTYLALRILENLNRGADPLFDADFQEPLRFLKRLVGRDISRKLDAASIFALQDVSTQVSRAWTEMSRSS
ncbi:MAG: YkvA family protein [Gemmatimonadota bacterium]|nr:YkvA family protein [Gemmatimonadota bacterium]MDE2864501.1 YkvA family protein [Gemmatimonadota bacterium]